MAVRSHLPWPWRAVLGVVLLVVIGGMWWWGFDFGQIFGGFNRKEVEARVATLEAEVAPAARGDRRAARPTPRSSRASSR